MKSLIIKYLIQYLTSKVIASISGWIWGKLPDNKLSEVAKNVHISASSTAEKAKIDMEAEKAKQPIKPPKGNDKH